MADQKTATMPKFSFGGCSIKNDEQMNEELAKVGQNDKFFKPGKHDVVIKEVNFEGLAKNDNTWGNLKITLQGTNEKTTNVWVMFPTQDVVYGKNKTMFPFKKLQEFSKALGEDLKVSTLEPVLKKLFAKPEKLVGKPLAIRMAYERANAKFVEKLEDGTVRLNLVLADGSLQKENGQVKVFEGADSKAAYNAVAEYATKNSIAYDAFPQVVEYFPATEKAGDTTPW